MEKRSLSLPVLLGEKEKCLECAAALRDALSEVEGVESVRVDAERQLLEITYFPDMVAFETLERKAHAVGAELANRFHTQTLNVTGLDCPDCAVKVDKLVSDLSGVHSVALNFATGKLHFEYDPDRVGQEQVVEVIESLGYGVSRDREEPDISTSTYQLAGLDCPECALKVERQVGQVPGVQQVTASATTQKMVVDHDPAPEITDNIIAAVRALGYEASIEKTRRSVPEVKPWWRSNIRILLTALSGLVFILGLVVAFLGGPQVLSIGLFLAAVAFGGYYILRGAYYSLRARAADMNLLMTIAVAGAIAIGEFTEAAAIVFLFSVANTVESFSLDRTRDAIRSLVALAPKEALALRNGRQVRVKVEDLRPGDITIVRPGERMPIDGVVVAGRSSVNESSITGESVPVAKDTDDEVFAGTINGGGSLEVRVTTLSSETTLAHIIELVEEAQTQKAATQQFVDRFSAYYTPAVIVIAAGVALVPWLLLGQPFSTWFYRGLVLLVIACPCALVISTPVSIVSAIGSAARHGALIKGGVYLEQLGNIKAVAFDKTGTLTRGKPRVTDIIPLNGLAANEVLALAASVEARSEHPLAGAVIDEARHQDIALRPTKSFQSFAGRGASASLNGNKYYVGSPRLFTELYTSIDAIQSELRRLQEEGKSTMVVGTENELVGILAVADTIRPASKTAVEALHRVGIEKVTMLTGDNSETAAAISRQLGFDDFRAELLPEDKVQAVHELTKKYGAVAMVGDGVNDAPALAASNVGIALGASGSDVALETADVALMSDDLSKLAYIIGLGRSANATIRQNIAFALAVKLIFLILTVFGFTTLWLAVVADMGASLAVVANGLRLLGYRETHLD